MLIHRTTIKLTDSLTRGARVQISSVRIWIGGSASISDVYIGGEVFELEQLRV